MRGTLTSQRYVDDILRPHVEAFLNGLPEAIFLQDMLVRIQQELLKTSYVIFRLFHGQPAPPICGPELVDELFKNDSLSQNKFAAQGLESMKLFFTYCELYDVLDKVSFDLSLARGLDYYTGIIFEGVLKGQPVDVVDENNEPISIGSIAGGGRYDNLVGMFDPKNKTVPCVGMSIGIERIFALMEAKLQANGKKLRSTETEVYVATAQKKLAHHRMKLCRELWDAGIKAEQSYKLNPKLLDQLQYCEARGIPLAIIIGESEVQRAVVKLRNVETREESEVSQSELIKFIKERRAPEEE
ncbi:histidine--tRNA ligase, cytoplasmic [Trichonephila clavipes]|nr:histidine--tRNA ligase, cytoplasmic [Trichonephila clavipes]